MDILLKDVSIVVVSNGPDTVIITPKNVSQGSYPFTGKQIFKVTIAAGTAKSWLIENFGEEIVNYTKFIKEE